MNINVTNTPDLLTIALAGRLDTATSPDFDNQVAQYLTPANVKDIVIDCSELEYISSAGLRSLIIVLKAAKDAGHTVRLTGVKEQIRTVLDMTGISSLFK